MARRTPVGAATAFNRRPLQRLARLAVRLVGREGPTRVPHAFAWRLRELIYRTPEDVAVHGDIEADHDGPHVLLVGNDLSRSGAPQLLLEIARLLIAGGANVTLVSPSDGALRAELVAAGAAVVVDPAALRDDTPFLVSLAGAADAVVCNTIVTAAAVAALAPTTPLIWYVHEISMVERQLAADTRLERTLALPARLWAGSELAAAPLRAVRPDVEVVPYGLDPLVGNARAIAADRPLRLGVFASIEPRKGQDLLLEALALLDPDVRRKIVISLAGRTLFPEFHAALQARLSELPEVRMTEALDADGYRTAMLACDAVVIPSRDDTLPLVSLDALGAGRVLMCTATTGTAAYLEHGVTGFVAGEASAAAIATMLTEAIARAEDWPEIGERARAVFARTFSRQVFGERLWTTLAEVSPAVRSEAK